MDNITIAVTDGATVYASNLQHFPMAPFGGNYPAALLCEACARRGIRQLWFVTAPVFTFDDTYGWDFRESGSPHLGERSGWVHSFKHGTNAEVDLVRPALDRNNPFHDAGSATDLLLALMAFDAIVGITFHHSASATSRDLLLRTAAGGKLRAMEMPTPALEIRTEEPLEWCLPGQAVRQLPTYDYVHAYDKNAAYLGAASTLSIGAGEFEHVTSGQDCTHLPGYFRINAVDWTVSADGVPAMPPARARPDSGYSARWVTTPTLDYLYELGGVYPQILDAYVWTDHHRSLTAWYDILRGARMTLQLPHAEIPTEAQQMALAAVKACYTSFLAGYLCSTTWDRRDDPLYRPDIRHMVIAKARSTLLRTVRRAQEDGAHVLGVSGIDTFYVLSNEPDPVLAKPLHLNLGPDQAFYKVKNSWALTPQIRAGLESDVWNTAAKLSQFKER